MTWNKPKSESNVESFDTTTLTSFVYHRLLQDHKEKQRQIKLRAEGAFETRARLEQDVRKETDKLKQLSQRTNAIKERTEKHEDALAKADNDFMVCVRSIIIVLYV